MKSYTKIVLVVALALFLVLTACTRQASKSPVATTPTGEVNFPFNTQAAVSNFGTQTAIASTPGAGVAPTFTPQVVVSTLTPAAGDTGAVTSGESGGGQQATATTGSAATVATPAVARPTTYTLQKGEWPICIARRYGLDLNTFFAANGMNMNSRPATGTVLKIPATGDWNSSFGSRTLVKHPATYTVAGGDTVNTIACKYGDVTTEAILAVNGLASASDLKSGSTIKIP